MENISGLELVAFKNGMLYQSSMIHNLSLDQSMAAYAALVYLAKVTYLNRYRGNGRFSMEAAKKIRYIHEYIGYFQSFLEDFPEEAKRWECRIRNLSHKADAFIEEYIWFRMQTHHQGRASPNIVQQLQSVIETLGLMAGDIIYGQPSYFPAVVSSSSSRHTPTGNNGVIGFEDDVKTIWHRLRGEPSNHLQFIPIVGMGGIGKTTLARTVYDHPSISDHFDFRYWTSLDYSLRKILLGLLESMNLLEELVLGKKIDGSDVDVGGREDLYNKLEKVYVSEMEVKVFQNLKYRRYLIVMDDVWSTKVLDDAGRIFPDTRTD